jgi:DNA-binding MarR family transcriptional regulator
MKIEEEIKEGKFRDHYQRVAVNILFTANWLHGRFASFFKQFGLTPQQFNILRILRGQVPNKISGVEIKARMLDRHSDISRLLDRLLKKNLISKTQCPNDKRAGEIAITPEGLALLSQIDSQFNKMERAMLADLSEEEALQLSTLLDKCRA